MSILRHAKPTYRGQRYRRSLGERAMRVGIAKRVAALGLRTTRPMHRERTRIGSVLARKMGLPTIELFMDK